MNANYKDCLKDDFQISKQDVIKITLSSHPKKRRILLRFKREISLKPKDRTHEALDQTISTAAKHGMYVLTMSAGLTVLALTP